MGDEASAGFTRALALARRQAPLRSIPPLEKVMMVDVAEVRPLGDHRVFIRFEDGVSGEVDIADVVAFEGVFAPLRDPVLYARVSDKPIRLSRRRMSRS
jgi:hypothetical protein